VQVWKGCRTPHSYLHGGHVRAIIHHLPQLLLTRGWVVGRMVAGDGTVLVRRGPIRKKRFGPKETQSNLGNFNFPKATLTL